MTGDEEVQWLFLEQQLRHERERAEQHRLLYRMWAGVFRLCALIALFGAIVCVLKGFAAETIVWSALAVGAQLCSVAAKKECSRS